MNYSASISDFFKSPKWAMNMLLGGLCVLIPVVGPIVIMGWLVISFWGREDEGFGRFSWFSSPHAGAHAQSCQLRQCPGDPLDQRHLDDRRTLGHGMAAPEIARGAWVRSSLDEGFR